MATAYDTRKGFAGNRDYLTSRYMAALRSQGAQGASSEAEFLRRSLAFDPQEAMNRYATGSFREIAELTGEQLEDFAGESVGAGRLDTGFYDVGRGDILKAGQRQLANRIAQQSLQATELGLRNTENIGAYGERATGRHLDMVSGGLDRATAEENLKRQRRAGLLGALGSIGGAAVGTFLLPGIGTAAGAQLGGELGGTIGG